MNANPNPNDPERNRGDANGTGDAGAPRKRGGAVLWLLLLVALLLLGWWWFGQRSAEQAIPAPVPGTATGEPAATAAADAEQAAAEARKRKAAQEKPRKSSKPAAARITEPKPIAGNPQPDYPRDAQRRGLSGRVLLRIDVAADGTATNVDFVQRSGTPELDRAAMNAVRKWRFTPARRDGKPVASSVSVPIDFVLPNS